MFDVGEHTTHTCMGIASTFMEPGWKASCSCGWEGAPQDTMGSAHADFESHKSWAESPQATVEVDYDQP